MKNLIIVLFALLVGCADGDDMSKTSWSQSGNLVTGEGVNGGISCQADLGEGHGDVYTVQFGITTFPALPPAPPVIIRPEAIITLTVNGCDVVRRISVNDGTSISGTAEKFKARLFDTLTAGMPGTLGTVYNGNIQISKGVRPATDKPPTLVPDQFINPAGVTLPFVGDFLVPPAGTAFILVPENAGIISVLVTASPAIVPTGPMDVLARQVSVATSQSSYDPTIHGFMPLWPGTTAILILNRGPDLINVSGLFGVDG